MSERCVAVAMSGGLDSSVVAWLLSHRGRERVIGLSMLLWDHSAQRRHGRCCGALDLADARAVAHQIGIPHYTLRMEEEFRRQVVDPFVSDYLAGRTPSPCVQCNSWIKFDAFLERALGLGADEIATGHYARILDGPAGRELHAARDPEKDQSYFLFEMTAEQLERTRFPLGELTKEQARQLAREAGLVVAEKGESMEVCFVANGVQEFVEDQLERYPERYASTAREGAEVVDESGRSLGRGAPYYRYTVGQRRGLRVAAGRRLYVLDVDPDANRVVVGGNEALSAHGLEGERCHWIGEPPERELQATVKIRSRHPGVACRIRRRDDGEVDVEFERAQRGVSPGQAAVFYEGSRVLGGCWIRSSSRSSSVVVEDSGAVGSRG